MPTDHAQTTRIVDRFESDVLNPTWHPWTTGTGTLSVSGHVLRCSLAPTPATTYSDAQITDYAGLPRRSFPWRPPVRLTVRAWASHTAGTLKGTAGFGFWNEPFVPGKSGLPRPPRATWFFFASPPSNMALARNVPGWGWKVATIDASRAGFWLLAPLAPLAFPLMRVPALYRALWPLGQRAIGVSEALLPVALNEPHTYALEWRSGGVRFFVDGMLIHEAPHAPRGPLGFIAWIDNQVAVVTPQGRFRFGLVSTTEPQWLSFQYIAIESLE